MIGYLILLCIVIGDLILLCIVIGYLTLLCIVIGYVLFRCIVLCNCCNGRFDRSRMMSEGILGDPLRDAESLLSFIKMEDGLLTPNQVRDPNKTVMTGRI